MIQPDMVLLWFIYTFVLRFIMVHLHLCFTVHYGSKESWKVLLWFIMVHLLYTFVFIEFLLGVARTSNATKMIQDLTDDQGDMKCLLNSQLFCRPSIHKSIGASHVDGNHSASGTMGSRHAKCGPSGSNCGRPHQAEVSEIRSFWPHV